jgi:hypothetical protein
MARTILLAVLGGPLLCAGCKNSQVEDDVDSGSEGDTDTDTDGNNESDGAADTTDSGTSTLDETDNDGDTSGDLPCPDPDASFDEDGPGVYLSFTLLYVDVMGQAMGATYGLVLPTAREDFDPYGPVNEEIPLDTCVPAAAVEYVPACATDEDCAPEQVCVPLTGSEDEPIPDSKHCETPRDPIDVGPMDALGFDVSGAVTYAYNPDESGAYTIEGAGRQISDPTIIAYDTEYSVTGDGGGDRGLGAFYASFYMPEFLEITAPERVSTTFGEAIEVDPTEDLTLEWAGGNPDGELRLELVGGGTTEPGTPYSCRVADDGEFTIPADVLQELHLGPMAFFNMWTLTRKGTGEICGEGITAGRTYCAQIVTIIATLGE